MESKKTSRPKGSIKIVAVGDTSPLRDDPPSLFKYCIDNFRSADIVSGQLETLLTDKSVPCSTPWPPYRLPPSNITGLTKEGAGFDVMSFAANHAMDYGWDGFNDTLNLLKQHNIPVTGAGANIVEARKPVILERNGVRVGFLAYLSVALPGYCAEVDRPGCVPLRATHYYEPIDTFPGTPPRVVSQLYPEDKQAMEEDIKKLRPQVDIVVVNQHCGVISLRAVVAMYQKEAARAAVDAGADLVLQHHQGILRGIETYKGGTIFYGINRFAGEHQNVWPGKFRLWEGSPIGAGSRGSKLQFPWKDPDRFKTMIVNAYIENKKIQKITYTPAYANEHNEPVVVTRKDPRAQELFDYVKLISEMECLPVNFAWDGDEVLVSKNA
jgi:poly-gamma-glutamate capsule biosynthesis protein CapA/YwtB (metallophosphatase superfamily)